MSKNFVKMSRIRQTIAKRMMESKKNTATLTSFAEIDVSKKYIHFQKVFKTFFIKVYIRDIV